MNALEKDSLIVEAKMQTKALRKINGWKKLAIIVSTIGVAIAYAGFSTDPSRLFLGILGIFLALIGAAAAVIINLGLRNGRRNVEKIINVIENEKSKRS